MVPDRSPNSGRILFGIDPGTAATGFGIVQEQGRRLIPIWYDCIRTPATQAASDRLVTIHRACTQVINHFRPHEAAIEELFFGANAKTALAVGQARGVLMLACAQANISVAEYSPSSIKQAVTGYGQADKAQVQAMVQSILQMSQVPSPDHAADALAVAICHAGSMPAHRLKSGVRSATT